MTRRGLVSRAIFDHVDGDGDRLVVAPVGHGCVVVEAFRPGAATAGVRVHLREQEIVTLAEALASYRGGVQ